MQQALLLRLELGLQISAHAHLSGQIHPLALLGGDAVSFGDELFAQALVALVGLFSSTLRRRVCVPRLLRIAPRRRRRLALLLEGALQLARLLRGSLQRRSTRRLLLLLTWFGIGSGLGTGLGSRSGSG